MKAMILAAGYGTRFLPATRTIPKPLIPLANRPLIGWATEALLDAGVDTLIVNLHHLPERMDAWLQMTCRDRCALHLSREESILGTAGGLRRVRSLLENEESFFLVNGDTVMNPPFARLADARQRTDGIGSLLLRHPPADDRFTKVWLDEGRISGFGAGSGTPLMFSGAHCLSSRIFEFLPDRERSGLTEDVYIPLLRDAEGSIAGVVDDGLWFDIGTPLRYVTASDAVRAAIGRGELRCPGGSVFDPNTQSIVAEDAQIRGEIASSVVASDCLVTNEARVEHSVLWNGSRVGEGAVVAHSILAEGVRIPAHARVSNALVCVDDQGKFETVPIDPSAASIFEIG